MIKKLKQRFSIAAVAAVLFVSSFSLAIGAGADASFAEASSVPLFSQAEYEQEYQTGTKINLPAVTASVGGEQLEVTKILHKPDGTSSVVTKSAEIDIVGTYTVEYRCLYKGKAYSEKYSFSTYKEMFELTSDEDTAVWCGTGDALGETLEGRTEMAQEYAASGITGEFISLSKGEKLIINDYFDISKADLSTPLIKIAVIPHTKGGKNSENNSMYGRYDFKTLKIRFISKEDESQYLTFVCNYYLANNCVYFQAGGQNQTTTGYESYSNTYHVGNIWGAPTSCTFVGYPNNDRTLYQDTLQLWLNYSDKTTYACSQKSYIIDLDDSKCFSSLWKGFDEGNVYVEIEADGYTGSDPAQFVIMSVGDIDLTQATIRDTVAPTLEVDFGEYDEDDLPLAVTGKPYTIFDASAYDWFSGDCKVTTRVFGRYNTSQKYDVEIENGQFIPETAGVYAIEYKASDYSGNTTTKVISITAVDRVEDIKIQLGEKTTQALTGENVELAVATATGGTGNLNVETYVVYGGREEKISDGYYRPSKSGNYTVKYVAVDYAGQSATASYVLNVSSNSAPVFKDDVSLPRYFIEGSTYDLPAVTAYDYSSDSGVKEVKAVAVVTDANGERDIADGKYTPVVDNHLDTVIIQWRATVNGQTSYSQPMEVTVCKVGNGKSLDMTGYFVSDGEADIRSSSDYISITTLQDSRIAFANALIAHNFSISFNVDSAQNAFSRINIYLEDPVTCAILKSSFIKTNGNQSYWQVNDGAEYLVDSSFNGTGISDFDFSFDNIVRTVKNGASDIAFTVSEGVDGKAFYGFESGYVYLTIELEGVVGPSCIQIKSIRSQKMSALTADTVKPELYLLGSMDLEYNINEKVTLIPAIALDVLDPNVTAYYSVYDPNGDIVKDVNGKALSGVSINFTPTVNLNRYGMYYVEYYVVDWNGRTEKNFSYSIEVVDRIPPVITISDGYAVKAKVGETVRVAAATAYDELDGALDNVGVMVMRPDGKYVSAKSGSFTATKAGKYTVVYYVYDYSGNTAKVTYTVTVEE